MRISGAIDNQQFLAMVKDKQAGSVKGGKDKPGNKYQAQPVKAGFDSFDSKHEARKAGDLQTLQKAGYITNLKTDKRELRFPLDVNGVRICEYEADARFDVVRDFEMSGLNGVYNLTAGQHIVYDAKSAPTRKKREYVLKRNLMFAIHEIRILEG